MDEEEVVSSLLSHAVENDASEAVVVELPPELLDELGGVYSEEADSHGRKVSSSLLAGPVEYEDEDVVVLDSPSRVGGEDDFSVELREKLRADGVYGFRDGNLDGVELPKQEVEIHRVEEI